MAKLRDQTKKVLRTAKGEGVLTSRGTKRLKHALKTPGVSDVEKKLRHMVLGSYKQGAQRQQVRRVLNNPTKHPNQGGKHTRSHTSNSSMKGFK